MTKNVLLMSIRPQHADKIFNRKKTVELRRIKPKLLEEGDLVFVYVSTPVKSLVGAFSVSSVIEKPLPILWEKVKDYACVSQSEFLDYYQGTNTGVGIFINDIWLLPKPIQLAELRKESEGFYPPQSFRYTSIQQVESFQ